MNTNALWNSLQSSLGAHIPQLFGALAIFVLGWVVAVMVRAGARRSLGFMGVNHRFGKLTGKGVDIEGAVALGLFWVVILLTLAAVSASGGRSTTRTMSAVASAAARAASTSLPLHRACWLAVCSRWWRGWWPAWCARWRSAC